MSVRTQITFDPEIHRRAQAKAAELGISFAEYVRRLLAQDLSATPTRKPHISLLFDLVDEGSETNIARDKNMMIAEAVWNTRLRKRGRRYGTRREKAFEMVRSGHSSAFRLFHQAILNRQQVTCVYQGLEREICPHILGHRNGVEAALVFQFGGRSSQSLPPAGEWRCLRLADVENVKLRSGDWHSGGGHRKTQRCVDDVYIDVNETAPNQPGRQ